MLVYVIRNKFDGRCYVGKSYQDDDSRWKQHLRSAEEDRPELLIDRAIKAIGAENFEYWVAAYSFIREPRALRELEGKMIASYGARYPKGYNATRGTRATKEGDSRPRDGL